MSALFFFSEKLLSWYRCIFHTFVDQADFKTSIIKEDHSWTTSHNKVKCQFSNIDFIQMVLLLYF